MAKTFPNDLAAKLAAKGINLTKANQVLPPVFTVILLIACSYTLSQITWLLIPGEEALNIPPSIPVKQQASTAQDSSQIINAHIFGQYTQTATVAAKANAPETRLNLVLKGVLAATPMEMASAIISMGKNGKEDIYSIGDKISSATIKEIHGDRVILERSGRLETLRMPKDFSNNLIRSVPSKRGSSRASTPGAVLSDIRKQILKNPTSFGKYAIPVPYNVNGKLKGYRLQPQGDRSLFDKVGLNPNDVIVSLNGIPLNNPAKGIKALRKLQSAKEINITVLRNGTEVPLHFEIP